jgi:hypothetical protein
LSPFVLNFLKEIGIGDAAQINWVVIIN